MLWAIVCCEAVEATPDVTLRREQLKDYLTRGQVVAWVVKGGHMRPKIVADASPLLRQWHRVLDDIHDKCRDDFTQKSGSELQRLMESIAVEGVLAFAEAYGTWSKDLKEQAARHADVDPGNGNRLASREEGLLSCVGFVRRSARKGCAE